MNCVKVFLFNDLIAVFRTQASADEYISLMAMMKGIHVGSFHTQRDFVPNIGF